MEDKASYGNNEAYFLGVSVHTQLHFFNYDNVLVIQYKRKLIVLSHLDVGPIDILHTSSALSVFVSSRMAATHFPQFSQGHSNIGVACLACKRRRGF